MKFSLTLLESDAAINSALLKEMASRLDIVLDKAVNALQTTIKQIIATSLKQEPEYSSLINGKLRGDFGIPDVAVVDKVIDAIVNTLDIQKKPITISNSGLRGGFTLLMMPSDNMGGVIGLDISVVTDAKGYSLPWLDWLLYKSNETIVKNYNIKYGPSPYSRSGLGIMVPSSESWRVPPEFAGSKDSNWTTRAVDRSESQIYAAIQQAVEKYI